ncbi:copper chaperone PCu(A)C [Defluviimonas sp. WL0024]|uniref:Copper chaperone PCu(A)C n=1 Tax=Albidovulum salinarum TaxID=2984153 RepID=A0ABT2X7B2_9RHOB|nr:copper chaperone PCu(A)C [Defluviimonas sp. WL0024]MCU9849803.1 copper chaperone PCu(A)C [Defluviimonas sp. WL0024]
MTFLKSALTAAAVAFALPAAAADTIVVSDAYARFMPGAMAGAAFMVIENQGDSDDRLIGVASGIAAKTELHTHTIGADGAMQMHPIEGGIALPAGASHALERGGDHVMFMGLESRPAEGETVAVTLTFEEAGEVAVEIPVDSAR